VTDITTGEKARLGRILRYLLLRMRTPKGTPFGITRSLPGPVRAASGHVTSGSSTSLHFAPLRSTSANVALSVPIYY
jgi:hypothetical protein